MRRLLIAATIPLASSQIDLFVGEPVKNLDTSEEKDSEALMPKIISPTPATSSAVPTNLVIDHDPLSV